MKKISNTALTVVLILLSTAPFQNLSAQESGNLLNEQVNKLGQALFYITQYHLDTLNTDVAVDEMIETLMGKLDPHSTYIPAEDVQNMNEPLEGNFEGIGIEFAIIRDTLVVVNPVAELLRKRRDQGRRQDCCR